MHVSDETTEGLGKHKFPRILFGALFDIFTPPKSYTQPPQPTISADERSPSDFISIESKQITFPWDPGEHEADFDDFVEIEECQHYSGNFAPLTKTLPDPGYFLAGGIAGVVSRTATAPLDRLKVYLIAQVGVKDDAIHAAKTGAPLQAAKTAGRPLIEATKTLWQMGGMRSLFAGKQTGWCLRLLV